jgi:hypothetical protein
MVAEERHPLKNGTPYFQISFGEEWKDDGKCKTDAHMAVTYGRRRSNTGALSGSKLLQRTFGKQQVSEHRDVSMAR